MQHPTQRFMASDMLASLRRWTGGAIPELGHPDRGDRGSMDAAVWRSDCSAPGADPTA